MFQSIKTARNKTLDSIAPDFTKMKNIYRTTKCFGVNGQGKIKGAFPKGFIEWIKKNDWWEKQRCYLCAGKVKDDSAIKVDVRAEAFEDVYCYPNLELSDKHVVADATNTELLNESFDWIMIDPPYTKELAKNYYGTDKDYHGINAFTKEAERLCKPNGLILTLSYEIPKRIPNCDFIAVVGVYTVPFTGYMRCFTVSRKKSGATLLRNPEKQESLIHDNRESSADSPNSNRADLNSRGKSKISSPSLSGRLS